MRAIIFDTETSGLIDNRTLPIEKQPEIIEFYGMVFDLEKGEKVDEIDTLVKPRSAISAEITKITTITNDQLAPAPAFFEVAPDIKAFLEREPVVIAHNLSFDIEMCDIEFERVGMKVDWPERKLCTVEATVFLKGFRMNLSGLHEYLFGTTFAGAHRARVDVEALARCAHELWKRGLI